MENFKTLQKKKTLETWLDEGDVLVHFDARHQGVSVPEGHENNPALTLKFSRKFNTQPEVLDEHFEQYLKFGPTYKLCAVPWDSVWGMSRPGGESKHWNEDIPKELLTATPRIVEEGEEKAPPAEPKPKPRPTLQRIK